MIEHCKDRCKQQGITAKLVRLCLFVVVGSSLLAFAEFANSHEAQLDTSVRLDQNFPNPFSGSTTIKYSIPEPGHVSMNLYNLLGEEMQNLVEKDLGANEYSYRFDAGNLPSGQYTYRLIFTGASSITKVSRKLYIVK